MGKIVVVMLCAGLLVGCQREYPGDMPGPKEAFHVRIDTIRHAFAVGDTLWSARWDGSGRIPLAYMDSTGLYVPICD